MRRNPSFWQRRSYQQRAAKALIVISLCALGLIFILPFYWSFVASVSSIGAVYSSPPRMWPDGFHFENYLEAMTILPFHLFAFNSVYICMFCVTGQVLSASLVAYGFARLRFWGRDFLFVVLLSTLMLPAQVTMIPHYQIFRYLGWLDTFKPIIVPSFIGGIGTTFYIFLMRQFFKTIPLELEEAARLDGCSHVRVFWDIAIPLSLPAVATVSVMSFVEHWQDFMTPLIYLSSFEKYPVSLGLRMFQSIYGGSPHYMLAASNLTVIPILVLFFMAQKYFVESITVTGMKG